MIELEKVTKWFDEKRLFKDLSLTVDEGDALCITGASGSGKTTLLKMIMGLEPPTQGRVTFMGKDVYRLTKTSRAYLRRNIGFIFQDFRLVPYLSIRDNVALPLRARGAPRPMLMNKVQQAMDATNIAEIADKLPAEVSGGEQQRAAIARVLAMEPVVVLADEPFGNLDHKAAAMVLEGLLDMNQRGAALLIATHDQGLADRIKAKKIDLGETD